MNLDDNTVAQDSNIQYPPVADKCNAYILNGVTNIRTRLCREPSVPVLIGREGQRPRPRRVAIVED
eukprot:769210-Pyramimonas_sp.AAC.1